ncbi:hypothetical protein SLS58_005621 [Diplodia intermedia]|uniref:BTB domain-containing protein n=1 Tax=Diplodia intermedia TaxID=856260 RepID=A0ABR3TQ19_9PEZI
MSTQDDPLVGSPSTGRDVAMESSSPSDPLIDGNPHARKRRRTTSFTDDSISNGSPKQLFPYFPDGDTIVTLKDSAKIHLWRLHSCVLSGASTHMREALASAENLTGTVENVEEIKFYLTLAESPQPPAIPLLVPCSLDHLPEDVLTRDHSSLYQEFTSPSLTPSRSSSVPTVKMEEQDGQSVSQRPGSHSSLDARIHSELCSAYDNLFRHTHNLPLRLSTAENIQHNAFVHLAGSFTRNVKQDSKLRIPTSVLNKLKKKNEQLLHMQEKTIGELFRLTIHVENKPVSMGDQLETWTVVQLFRDWLAVELDKIERRSTGNNKDWKYPASTSSNVSPAGIGSLLRRIQRGGEEYLAYDVVLKGLKETHEFLGSEWEDLAEDLRSLKKFASKVVGPLCRNNLMLDPELHRISYLICVDVGTRDLPWLVEATGV